MNGKDNMSKGSKIIHEEVINHTKTVKEFIKHCKDINVGGFTQPTLNKLKHL